MNCELSVTTSSRTPSGSCRASAASVALTRSATSTVFAPDCLRTTSATAERPSSDAAERASPGPSTTFATSRTRIRSPPGLATTRSRSSSTDAGLGLELHRCARGRGSSMRPPGTSMLWALIACDTSVAARP